MRLPLFIALRYLVSRKKQHAINIISGISITSVLVGTFALVVVLSVFNGFDKVVRSLFSSFDPELKVLPATGKRISADEATLELVRTTEGVEVFSLTLEENVLLKYNEKTHPARVKAVDEKYFRVTGLDTMIVHKAEEQPKNGNFCIVGQGLAYYLGVNLNFARAVFVYAPKRNAGKNIQAHNAFRRDYIIPSAIFSIRQEIDERYMIVPLSFASELFQTNGEISSIEIKTNGNRDIDDVKEDLQSRLGDAFVVKNRYQQHEFFNKVMKSEKLSIFMILSFILVIASFNILGSLTMLIIDKKKDVGILQSMGANNKTIKHIFMLEGVMITAVGAVAGTILGFIAAWVQQTFGLIKINTQGTLIIDTYPVEIQGGDFIWVLGVVILIGFIASWFPVQLLTKKLLKVK